LYTGCLREVLAFGLTNYPSSYGHVTSKFWEITDNISEMVQDIDIVTMKD